MIVWRDRTLTEDKKVWILILLKGRTLNMNGYRLYTRMGWHGAGTLVNNP